MTRRPPILGAVGMDFGYKPAISFVIPRKPTPFPFEEDECIARDWYSNPVNPSQTTPCRNQYSNPPSYEK